MVTYDIHHLFFLKRTLFHVVLIHEDHTTSGFDTPVSIIQPIDGGVVLVVAANGHHEQLRKGHLDLWQRMDREVGFSRRRGKLTGISNRLG